VTKPKQHFEVLPEADLAFPLRKSREVDALQAKLFVKAIAALRRGSAALPPANDTPPFGSKDGA